MADPQINRVGERIEVGTTVRVEKGPPLRRRRATEAALSNNVTAEHYQVGNLDAEGNPIVAGEMFAYLDWLGHGVFYVYKRREIDASDPRFQPNPDGSTPPLNPDSTNVTQYQYVFEEVGTFGTEDEALEFALEQAAEA